jgi:hypothetical protein
MRAHRFLYWILLYYSIIMSFESYCHGYDYIPTVLPPAERIIAIGDLHGDYELTIDSLTIAGVIRTDDKCSIHWIGKNTIVVQVGDQIDRCRPTQSNCTSATETPDDEASDIKIMELLTNLHKEAVKHGGKVISLLGNHELMNSLGDMSYVSRKNLDSFKNYQDPNNPNLTFPSGKAARIHAFAPGNEYGKFLGCTRLASVIIGGFLFMHAGLVKEFTDKHQFSRDKLDDINKEIRLWLIGLTNSDHIEEIIDSAENAHSPFWTRILGNIPSNKRMCDPECATKYIDKVLDVLQVGTMIIGHTPQFSLNSLGINSTCDGKIIRVDIGASNAFNKFDTKYNKNNKTRSKGRKVQVLEILNMIEKNTEISTKFNILTKDGSERL